MYYDSRRDPNALYAHMCQTCSTFPLSWMTKEVCCSAWQVASSRGGGGLQDMGAWMKKLGRRGVTCIGQADYKERFGVIPLTVVVWHMREVAKWVVTRWRWRATMLVLSVHKTNRRLDRAGQGGE